jgi:hypothetical protein
VQTCCAAGNPTIADRTASAPEPGAANANSTIARGGYSIGRVDMSQFGDDRVEADAGREWSVAELNQLGNMLVRGLSIEEIARRLRRDEGEVRDKVAEAGRACRASPHEPA